jgi:hypothetical protein
MPIPTPTPTESSKDFLERCMSDEVMLSEYPDQAQRFAVCSITFDKQKLKSKYCDKSVKNAEPRKP